jgi:hypothetical protein
MQSCVCPSCDAAKMAMEGLIRSREFLALQLDHAWGNISDEDFAARAEPYYKTFAPHLADDETRRRLELVTRILRRQIDPDVAAAMFSVPPDRLGRPLPAPVYGA